MHTLLVAGIGDAILLGALVAFHQAGAIDPLRATVIGGAIGIAATLFLPKRILKPYMTAQRPRLAITLKPLTDAVRDRGD